MSRRLVLRSVFGLGVLLLALCAWVAHFLWSPLGFSGNTREFEIEQGATLRSVARGLAAAGVIEDAWRFEALGRVLKREAKLKAGNYQLDARWSALELLDGITGEAAVLLDRVVLVEGWTFRQFRAALDAHPALRRDTAGLDDRSVAEKVGLAPEMHPEGLFFPDTYHFARGTSDLAVLRRAAARMQQILDRQWAQRREGLPIETPYEALILASIVEKETGRASDRPLIAAVLVNRLTRGMRLQVDPTVIYGLGDEFDGDLRRIHLERDTPYNTYTRAGLPPTPIGAPGLASIAAVMNPASSSALYFVSRGDGSSAFSETLADHNRAVQKYQRAPAKAR
jgi:UPF0755 protein